MPDKQIIDLPALDELKDTDYLVVGRPSAPEPAQKMQGAQLAAFVDKSAQPHVTEATKQAQAAAASAQTATTKASEASQSATQAQDAQQGAATAQDAAETARDQSVAAAGTIGDSVEQAQDAASQASSAKDAAVAAQTAAETAKTAAETASGQAQTAATQASGSATAAQTAATQAGDAKTDAETARNEAETSASSAANSASDAESAATEAEQAKTYIENMDMEGETLPAGSSVTVTKTTSPEGNLLFVIGVPQGIQGDRGETGETGETGATGPQGVSVTNATVNEDGDLVITLSAGDPINAGSVIGPQGIQGEVGPPGASVDRIERTSGTGAPGTTDTYTVYLTDGQTGGTFQVYNGSNGTGSGDFMADGSVPMTGDLQMGGHKITNLAEPTDNTDAASKEYVDDTITVSLVGNYIPMGQKGQANGVASLDDSGKVPSAQLPPMGYVPTSRTVNGHALSADVTLDAEDVGARPSTWTPSAKDVGAIPASQKGAASGVAELDSTGRVPSSQLPSYVDDVLEYDSLSSFPETGEDGKIYIAENTNLQYRWSGSQYVEISPSLALGETSSTAYRGDRGKTAYDHSQSTGNPHNTTAADVGARADTWMPTASEVGAVPTSRTVNGKALSSNITLTADDVNAASLPTSTTVTLTAAGWSSNAQTVTVSGVVASETAQLITPTPAIASQSAYYEAGIMCTGQAANSLTFTCQTVPTSNLTVYVVIQPLS